jgi:hypothetical protein
MGRTFVCSLCTAETGAFANTHGDIGPGKRAILLFTGSAASDPINTNHTMGREGWDELERLARDENDPARLAFVIIQMLEIFSEWQQQYGIGNYATIPPLSSSPSRS